MQLQNARILVVEDEYHIAKDIAEVVTELHGEVLGPTGNPDRALVLAADIRVDVAVVDINLGTGIDFEVADHLMDLGVSIVFVSGYDPELAPDRHQNSPWLVKPYRLGQLEEALCAAVKYPVRGNA